MENPWNVESIYELQFFNCPSCIYKNYSKQEIINHAFEFHSESVEYLKKIKDKSLDDIALPWEFLTKEIKTEVENGNFDDESVAFYQKEEDNLNFMKAEDIKTEPEIELENSEAFVDEVIQNVECNLYDEDFFKRKSFKNPAQEKARKFKCETCGKAFVSSWKLKEHIKCVHEQIRDHKCDDCEKSFISPSHLKIHKETIHEGLKKYICDNCGKAFNIAAHLK